jgi:hypothetical protein
VTGLSEHGNVSSRSIKGCKSIGQLSDCKILLLGVSMTDIVCASLMSHCLRQATARYSFVRSYPNTR